MKRGSVAALLSCVAALFAPSIVGGTAGAPSQGVPTTEKIAEYVTGAFQISSRLLIRAAEDMPEENYGMKLGTMPEMRTFGQTIGHIINFNFLFCARGNGEANPARINYESTSQTKAELVKAMHGAIDYCETIYVGLTDASAFDMVTSPQGGSETGHPYVRVHPLLQNIIHNNEQYGYVACYFRAKNLVPPSTALRNRGRRDR